MKLAKKVAVLTGAGSGIGRATALLFAKEGATVVVVDIDAQVGQETVNLIEQNGGQAVLSVTDITNAADVQAMVNMTLETYHRLDILVNVAGIFTTGTVVEATEDDWHRILGVNLDGTFLCMKYCIPAMLKGGEGVVVNVSSEAGLVGLKNQVAYNVSKSGVIALTKSTALDFADQKIRVNCLCPGRTLTPLVEQVISDSDDPEHTRRVLSEDRPMKRMGTPEEIAAGLLFLAADATYATGTILALDGGYTTP
ncbi:glucose 1-dehydrogenase [candidate division KSB3 bacterium]|uniref:Glucose 1-dehydrogenase n=1 Tax=candidate division KSB3 bacterium TaxID=2044937 RepID=A0A9D5JZJ6_9BACT|nr:glucose 1-dehydrogenase [candidate division KSB3 bacterium]